MMDRTELLAIYDREQRVEWTAPDARREDGGRVIRYLYDAERSGYISYSALDESTVEEEITRQLEYFRGLGYEFEWKVYDHDKPADLRRRLAARGLAVEEIEALLVLDLENAPDFYWTMPLPQITKISDPERVPDVMRLEEEVWGTDHSDLGNNLARVLRENPGWLDIFAVYDGERAASAAWIYYHAPTRFASLWGGSTLPAYRKRGYYTALLAVRAREARERGFRFLTVDASPMSRPILEKHGFQFLGYSTPCVWKPAKE